MEKATVFNKLKAILSDHIPGHKSEAFQRLDEQTHMANDLGIESLDIVSIVIDVEDTFNIEIDNDSIKQMSTIGNCINLIREKLCAKCAVCAA